MSAPQPGKLPICGTQGPTPASAASPQRPSSLGEAAPWSVLADAPEPAGVRLASPGRGRRTEPRSLRPLGLGSSELPPWPPDSPPGVGASARPPAGHCSAARASRPCPPAPGCWASGWFPRRRAHLCVRVCGCLHSLPPGRRPQWNGGFHLRFTLKTWPERQELGASFHFPTPSPSCKPASARRGSPCGGAAAGHDSPGTGISRTSPRDRGRGARGPGLSAARASLQG